MLDNVEPEYDLKFFLYCLLCLWAVMDARLFVHQLNFLLLGIAPTIFYDLVQISFVFFLCYNLRYSSLSSISPSSKNHLSTFLWLRNFLAGLEVLYSPPLFYLLLTASSGIFMPNSCPLYRMLTSIVSGILHNAAELRLVFVWTALRFWLFGRERRLVPGTRSYG